MKKRNVDWAAVGEAIRRSVTGRAAQADLDLCAEAWVADPEKYGKLHAEVKGEEIDVLKSFGRGL